MNDFHFIFATWNRETRSANQNNGCAIEEKKNNWPEQQLEAEKTNPTTGRGLGRGVGQWFGQLFSSKDKKVLPRRAPVQAFRSTCFI